ncbi:YpdA family putative bacillithiol disulfide reductase [candidate division KSB1 bacterium]|nr:YpdA family putative bacillithiol disulfide reductase [candidate division KSB1 bacterium]
MKYDIIIIGAGPIGLTCGIEAKRRKRSHLILEKGCLVNSLYHFPTNMIFFSTSDRLEIGDIPFVSHGDKAVRSEALEYYRRVAAAWQLNIHSYERVIRVKRSDDGFEIESDNGSYRANAVIIATGFYDQPNMLGIPGEQLPKVSHYFRDVHPYAFQKLAIIGGANSAAQAALEGCRRLVDVTLIVREAELSHGIKYWIRPDILNRIEEGRIKAYYNTEVTAIHEKTIDVNGPNGVFTLENDFVLALTGYHPDYQLLTSIGIEISNDDIKAPAFHPGTHETNVPGCYLAGVVCGGMRTGKYLIENSRDQAVKIFDHLCGRGDKK